MPTLPSHPVGIHVVVVPGSCSEGSVFPVLSVNSGTHAQGLISPAHSSDVSLTSAQLIDYSHVSQLQTMIRNLGSNFKLFAQHANSSFVWSISSL